MYPTDQPENTKVHVIIFLFAHKLMVWEKVEGHNSRQPNQ